MTYADLLKLKKVEPFQPFDLVLVGGRRHRIRHSELLKVGRQVVAIGIPGDDYEETGIVKHVVSQLIANIERAEPLEQTANL